MTNSKRVHILDHRDKELVDIVLQGDPHVGNHNFNETKFLQDRDYSLSKGHLWLNMGDAVECATRHSVGGGVYEQDEALQAQIEEYKELVMPLAEAGLLVGNLRGNHEYRAFKESGIDPAWVISQLTQTPYFGKGVLMYVMVGDQNYTMYVTHGNSGARLPHTKIKACIDMEKMIDAEVYGMAHLHTMSHHARQFYDFDKRGKTLVQKEKHFIITGCYLDHWDSYAHEANMEPSKLGSAKVRFDGTQHRIRVS